MRSLFVKLFLWFWLVSAVVAGVVVLVVWLVPVESRPRFGTLRELHGSQVRGVLATRDAHGPAAFAEHAEALERASGFRTFWLDAAGRDLLGQQVPPQVRDLRDAHEVSDDASGRDAGREGPPIRLEFDLHDAQGRLIRAVAIPLVPERRPYMQEFVASPGFLVLVAGVIGVAGLGCYALARYLSRPMRRLQDASRRFAIGDLAARVDPRLTARRDEIGDLARDLDRMAEQVQGVLSSHTRLLADVSHELRSPLARLNVAIGLAARHVPAEGQHPLERASHEADRVNELIGRLITLARLESDAVHVVASPQSLDAIVRDAAADADFEAQASDRSVRMVRCDSCSVRGEAPLLASAVDNVIRNAVQFTERGSTVDVTLRREARADGDRAVIEVRDHGPGVPPDALAKIFEPFYRVSDARERADGSRGTGLGLAITARAIRLHGGGIEARNLPDEGLEVRLWLPALPEGAAALSPSSFRG